MNLHGSFVCYQKRIVYLSKTQSNVIVIKVDVHNNVKS